MKKLLTTVALVICSTAIMVAQTTLIAQNFEVTKTVIPAGWTQEKATTDKGWEFSNAYGSNMSGYVAAHTYCTFVDDWDNNLSHKVDYDTLFMTTVNCSTYSTVYLGLDYMFWQDDGNETGTIIVSTNGGLTWTTAVNLPDGGGSWSNGNIFDISSYAAGHASVLVGFTYYNGYATTTNGYVAVGMCVDNINLYAPSSYDVNIVSQNLPYLMQVGSPYTFSGVAFNNGTTAITGMTINYSANGGPVQSQVLSGISGFSTLTNTNWTANTIPFTPGAAGNITVKYWASNLNVSNPNTSVDTLYAYFMAVNAVQTKKVLFEEFSNASCNPCMYAVPNVDSVLVNNAAICNPIRYHWYFPGRDFMNVETSAIVNSRMNTYYDQYGVPDGELDGANTYPGYAGPGSFSSTTVQQAYNLGSPFGINITSATYNTVTKQYNVNATITSYGTFASGLTAQAALTVDTITYSKNQSQEDPDNSFVSMGGSNPDYLRAGLLAFPEVVEDMLPSVSGTALTAFTPLSTQNLTLSWTKNHPWGEYPKGTNVALGDTTLYDSTMGNHITIFIQTNAGIAGAGVPAQYVFQSAAAPFAIVTGLQEVSNGVYFEMYPNPAKNNTNIAFSLDKSQNVSIEVYNMLGENVYSSNEGKMGAGQHTISINSAGLESGVYVVRFNTDNGTTTNKLVIQK